VVHFVATFMKPSWGGGHATVSSDNFQNFWTENQFMSLTLAPVRIASLPLEQEEDNLESPRRSVGSREYGAAGFHR
jgi:hypothetical protein